MSRILAVDYGTKRCGIAVTDPMQIIATALSTIETKTFHQFIKNYLLKEKVETIVFGMPVTRDGQMHAMEPEIQNCIEKIKLQFPEIGIERIDERLTSRMAQQAILLSGANKTKRSDKSLIDKVSAVIILQSFLEKRNNNRI